MVGNGIANSRPAALRLAGDLVGDRMNDGVGEDGRCRERTDKPFGDAEARVRVSEDAFVVVIAN